jgi:hypothetical protein
MAVRETEDAGMRHMQIGKDADLARLDHMPAEAGKIARTGAAGIDRGRHPGGATELLRVDAERSAAPVDMGVEIDQSRRDDGVGYIANVGSGIGFQIGAHLRHLAGGEGNVPHRVKLLGRVDHPAAAQDQIDGHGALSQ